MFGLRPEFDLDEPDDVDSSLPEVIFSAQQTVLANIMVVSALLLGFIVTGTLLSIGLSGHDNYGITELVKFFCWSSAAAMFAFISLITSFLTSVWGAHRMLAGGAVEAARSLSSGSVLRRILAESSLYMSMFCFLASLNIYIWMVYSGPDICPTYRGSASFCARLGEDLYVASAPFCKPRCQLLDIHGDGRRCRAGDNMTECLCKEVCKFDWEQPFNWSTHASVPNPGVAVHHYHWFGYKPLEPMPKAAREKIVTAASSLMCNHERLEDEKEHCFEIGSPDCTSIFVAWQKSEECMEGSIQDAWQCSKVCSWTRGYPPRAALKLTTDLTFIPLAVVLILLTFTRLIVMALRAYYVFSRRRTRVHDMLLGNHPREDGEGSESGSDSPL